MNEKKSRLARIKDEAKELHPLLEKLLEKLPRVTHVEYTHGTTEMGADFVISRQSETFGHNEYIGIIAKVGKIVQNYSGIERQIEECGVPRTIFGGKEKVRLAEVWVIVTEHITKGAQEKIHEKYALRKIVFIDGQELSQLIDKHMPVFWSQVSIEVGDYLTSARTKNEQIDRTLSLVPIGDKGLYIEQDIYEFPRRQYRIEMMRKQKRPKKASLEEITSQTKLVLIEGGMGSGKSKLIRHIVDHLTTGEVFLEKKLIPVPTTYGELQDNFGGDLEQLVQKSVPHDLRSQEKEISFLVLIDSLDEKNIPVNDEVETLRRLTESMAKDSKTRVIVTSRYLVGLDSTCELENEIVRYQLAHLTFSKMVEFIKALCSKLNLSKRLIEDLKKSQLFKELPQSPIAAILLAKLLNENPKELPSNMTELYSQYIELMLGRWDVEKGLQTLKEYQAIDHILRQVARQLLENELPYLTLADTRIMVSQYLNIRNLEIDQNQLFERMSHRYDILTVDDERNLFGFKHRSFAEFLCARDMLQSGYSNVVDRALDPYWLNTVFFYLGAVRDCPKLIERILALQPSSEVEAWVKIFNMGNYFLAAYSSPYNVITEGVARMAVDAATLFVQIATRQVESPFAWLPQMHLLYLLQMLVRESYSYEFLKPAIEEAALLIDADSISDDIKAYAIFFLNVAYVDLGGEESFDFLLKGHSENLPIDLALAIGHEGEDLKTRTALMRKQDRRIRKLLRRNPSLRAHIKAMYEKPIRGTEHKLVESK